MESEVPTCPRGDPLPRLVRATVAALFAIVPAPARASDLVEVLPLTDRVVMLHFDDGHVVYHRRGESRGKDRAVVSPLDARAASEPERYTIGSTDDPAYARPRHPLVVGRKSKGTEFACRCDWSERERRCVNAQPDHAKEHWIYLTLPTPLVRGKSYTIRTGALASNGGRWTFEFDEVKTRSEAVHVNLLGYAPGAPEKFAYVYHWMGDLGGLALRPYENRPCRVIDRRTSAVAFTSKLVFRRGPGDAETGHTSDTPRGNFLGAEVYECDFSRFDEPGEYVMAVEGIGRSFPFRIDADVYREAFRATARSLYHNRSGIALTEPYTSFTRPAPHSPRLTPGFAGKLIYTTVRFTEWGLRRAMPRRCWRARRDRSRCRAGTRTLATGTVTSRT